MYYLCLILRQQARKKKKMPTAAETMRMPSKGVIDNNGFISCFTILGAKVHLFRKTAH